MIFIHAKTEKNNPKFIIHKAQQNKKEFCSIRKSRSLVL